MSAQWLEHTGTELTAVTTPPAEDEPPRGGDVAVISDGFWRREFGAATDVVGQPLLIDAHEYRVIGVAPRGFTGIDLDRVDLWLPLGAAGVGSLGPEWRKPGVATWLRVLVRRKAGVSPARVDAELLVDPSWSHRRRSVCHLGCLLTLNRLDRHLST